MQVHLPARNMSQEAALSSACDVVLMPRKKEKQEMSLSPVIFSSTDSVSLCVTITCKGCLVNRISYNLKTSMCHFGPMRHPQLTLREW